jgi:hypothetical protein
MKTVAVPKFRKISRKQSKAFLHNRQVNERKQNHCGNNPAMILYFCSRLNIKCRKKEKS